MKKLWAIVLFSGAIGLAHPAFSEEPVQGPAGPREPGVMCIQAVSCGTKNGKRKEYPTPCAARDDGATSIKLKSGLTCEDTSK
jgi:hypothetical protein